MRNRAKCKLCQEIIESKFSHDFVKCKCGEIFVDGGNEIEASMRFGANDFANFLRVDDKGNETCIVEKPIVTAEDHIELLDDMIRRIEALPEVAMYQTVNQYDYLSLMIWLRAFSARIVAEKGDQSEHPPS